MSLRVVRCVLDHLTVKGVDRLVLVEMANHAHDDGTGIWAAQPTLADETGLHRATIQRSQERLQAAGLLAPDGRGKHATLRWRIPLCPACVLSAAESSTKQRRTADAAQSGTKRPARLSAAQSGRGSRTERQDPPHRAARIYPEPVPKGAGSGGAVTHPAPDPPAPPQAAGGSEPGPEDAHAIASRYLRAALADLGRPPPTKPETAEEMEANRAEAQAGLRPLIAAERAASNNGAVPTTHDQEPP
jgi:hypothetical protein